jgi:hypothetical protein
MGRDSTVNWSVYLHDYGRYMSPLPAGSTDYLTDCNVTYKRSILDQYTALWRTEFHETTVNWALTKDGHTLWLAPELSVGQRRIFTFAHAVWDRYAFGRLFASTRVAATSLGRRAYYAVFTPVLPALLVARAGQTVLSKRRAIDQFLRSLPMLLLLTSVWSVGELVGYLTGTAPKALSPDPTEDAAVMDPREAH